MIRLLVFVVALAACTKTDSNDILTSGVYADLAAIGDGTTTDVSATLFLGEPIHLTYLDLEGDDQLIASHGSDSKTMVESIVLNMVSHHAEFATSADGDEFAIAFDRSVDAGAPSSVATLPPGFALEPVAAATQSRASELAITWSPAGTGDAMAWQATGDCIELEGSSITGDTGSATIAPNTLKKRMGTNIADQCAVTITVTRSRPGQLDAHYGKGGQISGQQRRSVTFTSAP